MSWSQTEELKRLRSIVKTLGDTCVMTMHPGTHKMLVQSVNSIKERIADLEVQQAQADEWADSRMFVQEILADSSFPQRLIWLARYARHLEEKAGITNDRA